MGRDDLVVMVSKSGATEELLRLVPYAKASQDPYLRVHAFTQGFPRFRFTWLQ